jgi:hypothetical protein
MAVQISQPRNMHNALPFPCYQIGPVHTPLHRDVERQWLSVRRFADRHQAIIQAMVT